MNFEILAPISIPTEVYSASPKCFVAQFGTAVVNKKSCRIIERVSFTLTGASCNLRNLSRNILQAAVYSQWGLEFAPKPCYKCDYRYFTGSNGTPSAMTETCNNIRTVGIFGGTHGNELTGITLARQWMKNPAPVKRSSFHTSVAMGNPRAVEKGYRLIDCDLNRCFTHDILR